jgi:hypothetical protein
VADREPCAVIDIEERRWVAISKAPPIVFGSVELDGDRIRLMADTRLTADAAELLAHELYRLAGLLREVDRG